MKSIALVIPTAVVGFAALIGFGVQSGTFAASSRAQYELLRDER